MSKSTASFIAYDLRPAKQAERRMLLDYFEAMKEAGLQVSSYRYLGMGGIKFYDFSMIYRFLGITQLVSCERSLAAFTRGAYNRPFSVIDVRNQEIGNFITTELADKETLCWLDYDDSLSYEIVADIINAGIHLKIGSAFFITVASGMPRKYTEMPEGERLSDFKEQFGQFASEVIVDDMEESTFKVAYWKVLDKAFINAFSARSEGQFQRNFCVEYSDSTPMITMGGCFIHTINARQLKASLKRRMKFLSLNQAPYKIRNFNLTERERHLFDIAASGRANCTQANKLRSLGFKTQDLRSYRELVRFLPRYFEAFN